jgi:hypothetical protein
MPEKNVGFYSPALAKRIRDNSFAWERESQAKPVTVQRAIPDPIYFYNASSHTIPAYGCIQIVGTESIDDQYILKVDRPFDYTDSVMGPFLFNGPAEVEANGLGTAQWGPIYRAISDGGTYSIGTRFGPIASSFEMGKGPLYTYMGQDDVVEDCVRLIACETPLLAIADSSGISANSSGTVVAKQPASGNWTAGTVSYTAWNPTGVGIASNALCLIYPVDAKWVALELC